MAYPNEQDPLLPKDERSPEIHGSRPVSINYSNADHDDNGHQHITDSEFNLPRNRARSNRLDIVFFALQALLIGILLYVLVLAFGATGALNWLDDHIPRHRSVTERVNKILADTPLIDGHNDLAITIRAIYNNHIYEKNFTDAFENGGMYGHVDLPRLKEGKVGGSFWAAFAPCPKNGSDFSDENYADSVTFTLSQIDVIKRLQSAYPAHFSSPPNGTTALSAFQNGQLISPIAIEGLHQIGNSFSTLRNFYDLGVRYATLTHNCHNKYADAALIELPGGGVAKATPMWGGVSPAGRKLIHEMNRIGVIVDLSHVSQGTMRDVLGGGEDWDGSIAPIIYSHSSAYAVCPHPRNVPDDILQLVKTRNSVVMVNFAPDFISCVANASNTNGIPDFYPQNSTLEHVVEHIKHIGELIGYDHVGLGSDFDGIGSTPQGLDDVSKYPDLVAELLRQGISDNNAKKIVGENLLRVWKDVDNVAKELQAKGEKPAEDDPPKLVVPGVERATAMAKLPFGLSDAQFQAIFKAYEASKFSAPAEPRFKFRILVIGEENSGKRRLCNKVFSVDLKQGRTQESEPKGSFVEEIDFAKQKKNLIIHQTTSFKHDTAARTRGLINFIENRQRRQEVAEQLHAIWYCVPLIADEAIIQQQVDTVLSKLLTLKIPILIIFTNYDVLGDAKLKQISSKHEEEHPGDPLPADAEDEATKWLEAYLLSLYEKLDYPDIPFLTITTQSNEASQICRYTYSQFSQFPELPRSLQKAFATEQQVESTIKSQECTLVAVETISKIVIPNGIPLFGQLSAPALRSLFNSLLYSTFTVYNLPDSTSMLKKRVIIDRIFRASLCAVGRGVVDVNPGMALSHFTSASPSLMAISIVKLAWSIILVYNIFFDRIQQSGPLEDWVDVEWLQDMKNVFDDDDMKAAAAYIEKEINNVNIFNQKHCRKVLEAALAIARDEPVPAGGRKKEKEKELILHGTTKVEGWRWFVSLPFRILWSINEFVLYLIFTGFNFIFPRPAISGTDKLVEWTCDCGEVLWHGFQEPAPPQKYFDVDVAEKGPDTAEEETPTINKWIYIFASIEGQIHIEKILITNKTPPYRILQRISSKYWQWGTHIRLGKWIPRLFLEIGHVHFMKLAYTALDDEWSFDDPGPSSHQDPAIPPSRLVDAGIWEYAPNPMDFLPPIPSPWLAHFLNHHADKSWAGGKRWTDRIPKLIGLDMMESARQSLTRGRTVTRRQVAGPKKGTAKAEGDWLGDMEKAFLAEKNKTRDNARQQEVGKKAKADGDWLGDMEKAFLAEKNKTREDARQQEETEENAAEPLDDGVVEGWALNITAVFNRQALFFALVILVEILVLAYLFAPRVVGRLAKAVRLAWFWRGLVAASKGLWRH